MVAESARERLPADGSPTIPSSRRLNCVARQQEGWWAL
jgi:hypothetical protein